MLVGWTGPSPVTVGTEVEAGPREDKLLRPSILPRSPFSDDDKGRPVRDSGLGRVPSPRKRYPKATLESTHRLHTHVPIK